MSRATLGGVDATLALFFSRCLELVPLPICPCAKPACMAGRLLLLQVCCVGQALVLEAGSGRGGPADASAGAPAHSHPRAVAAGARRRSRGGPRGCRRPRCAGAQQACLTRCLTPWLHCLRACHAAALPCPGLRRSAASSACPLPPQPGMTAQPPCSSRRRCVVQGWQGGQRQRRLGTVHVEPGTPRPSQPAGSHSPQAI